MSVKVSIGNYIPAAHEFVNVSHVKQETMFSEQIRCAIEHLQNSIAY